MILVMHIDVKHIFLKRLRFLPAAQDIPLPGNNQVLLGLLEALNA
jgi:hypothetical protein